MPLAALVQRLLLLAILIAGVAAPVVAQQAVNPVEDATGRAERQVDGFRGTLNQVTQTVSRPAVTNEQLTQTRSDIERIRIESAIAAEKLASPLTDLQAQLKKLPPPPAKDTTEPAAIATERARLSGLIDRVTAARSQLAVVAVEAEQLAGRVAALQRDRFIERVFEPSRSILNPALWTTGSSALVVLAERFGTLVLNWRAAARESFAYPGLVAAIAISIIATIAWLIGNVALKRVRRDVVPDNLTRLWRAVVALVVCVSVAIVAFEAIEIVLQRLGLMVGRIDRVIEAANAAVITLVAFWTFAIAVFRPTAPGWRLAAVDDRTAASNATLLVAAGIVIALANFLFDMASTLFVAVEANHLISGVSATSLLILATMMLSTSPPEVDRSDPRSIFPWLRRLSPFLWMLLAVSGLALLLGYIALSDFITTKIFESMIVLSFLFMLHYLADAAVSASVEPTSRVATFLRERVALSRNAVERLGLIFSTTVDLLLVVAGIPLMFGLWWFNWIDYGSVISAFFTGFQVGDVTITPWSMVLAILIFIGGLVFMRVASFWLDRRVLSRASFDDGVRNSILTGTRYVLTGVAAIFAASAAGLDFSNLALVAGALGVGIGFGLQSIVGNFVSGLILLAERPIKVGDWVILSGGEGIVKRINVRSTEIETFDRATVIVPNSSLITDVVKNRTHADRLGRSVVMVSVEYGSDPKQVSDILEELGRKHPSALQLPAPFARFTNFGEFGMDFTLYVFIGEVSDVSTVESDLRFAIWKRFDEEGITIATPLKESHARHHAQVRRGTKPA